MANQINTSDIREHAEVVGSDHQHVGKVDHLHGDDQIKLTKNDADADNAHHLIPVSWIGSIDDSKIVLTITAAEAQQQWQSV